MTRLNQSFMFRVLDEKEKQIVVDAMEERRIPPDTVVINQGDDGDCLFLVESGELKCERVEKKGAPAKYLKTYQQGEAFGELALLYNAPRAATIRSVKECVLF